MSHIDAKAETKGVEATHEAIQKQLADDDMRIEDTVKRGAFFQDWRLASLAAKKGHRGLMVTTAGDFVVLTDMQELRLRNAATLAPNGQTWEHCFKNFHRSLCERFGYVHDEVDWFRDQVSLEEYIYGELKAPAPPESQRHARINCNGKSCGEFNCDTCHPQEGELSEELHDLLERVEVRTPTEIVVRKTQSELEKCKAAFTALRLADQATIAETLAAAIEQSQRAKKADVELKAMTEDRNLWRDAHNDDCPNIIRAEAAEAELAALKATPKEIAREKRLEAAIRWALGEGNSDFAPGGEKDGSYWWRSRLRYLAFGNESSPTLPLEEPEQVISDGDINWIKTFGSSTLCKAMSELEAHRRALAARRGGR